MHEAKQPLESITVTQSKGLMGASRRFRPPQDVLDWREGDDPRDATVAPASCVQRKDYFFADFAGAAVDAPRDDRDRSEQN